MLDVKKSDREVLCGNFGSADEREPVVMMMRLSEEVCPVKDFWEKIIPVLESEFYSSRK